MTSRSLKKPRITALTGRSAIRTDRTHDRGRLRRALDAVAGLPVLRAAALVAAPFVIVAAISPNVLAQSPSRNAFANPGLTQPRAVQTTPVEPADTTPAGWNLRWRKSSRVTPKPVHVPTDDVFAETPIPASRDSATTRENRAANQPNAFATVRQTTWQETPGGRQTAQPTSQHIRRVDHTENGSGIAADFFSNPFMDDAASAKQTAPRATTPAAADPVSPTPNRLAQNPVDDLFDSIPVPKDDTPANPYRGGGETGGFELPDPGASDTALPEAAPQGELLPPSQPSAASDASTMRDLFESEPPPIAEEPAAESIMPLPPATAEPDVAGDDSATPGDSATQKPATQESASDRPPFNSPFADRDRADRDRLREQTQNAAEDDEELSMRAFAFRPSEMTCDEFRDRIASETIDKLTLDISPPFRPDIFNPKKYEEEREFFQKNQKVRQWYSIDGRPLGKGRLIDLAYEQAIIETEYGAREELPLNRMSEGDLGYLSETWGLPRECLVRQDAYAPRAWTPLTMTWKASNICHKPKYFEEVNLERYGHTAGPILQPVVSSAHFFANIAVLPYKMGVHAPNECQYALGYYRPGNCAPWILPPVPISARGALAQGAFMTGAFWLIP